MSVPPKGEELPKRAKSCPRRERAKNTLGNLPRRSLRRPEGGTGAWRIDQDHHGLDRRRRTDGQRVVGRLERAPRVPGGMSYAVVRPDLRAADHLRTGRRPVVNREGLEALRAQLTELVGAIDAALG